MTAAGPNTIVDAHVHVAARDSCPGATDTTFGRPPPVRADVGDLWRVAEPAGVGQAVLVQPASLGLDHSHLLQCIARRPDRFVGTVLVHRQDPAGLERLLDRPGGDSITSVRLLPLLTCDDDWFAAGADPIWRIAEDRGLVVSVLAGPASLPALVRRASRQPETVVVLDHLGRPDLATDPMTAVQGLRALSALPRAHLKVSALALMLARLEDETALQAMLDAALGSFGAERCMWGSDHPFVGADGYAADVTLALRLLGHRDALDRDQVLQHTARRVFGLPSPPTGHGQRSST